MSKNFNWGGEQLSFLDVLTILSFIIGVENLSLNQKQATDLEAHLSKQDSELLSKIIAQNEKLIQLDTRIIKLLEEDKDDRRL